MAKRKKAPASTASEKHEGTRSATNESPPPTFALPAHSPRFITPTHPSFGDCMDTAYDGFVRESADVLPAEFHTRFRSCLQAIQANGLLARHDITQPMGPGTRLAKTRVTRCLIGKPGITYRYLGLRMFAHPWSGPSASRECAAMRSLSRKLDQRAEAQGGTKNGFNLVLLNSMVPEARQVAKQERDYGLGSVSVSWHADCSLQDFSTISVYLAQHPCSQDNFTSDSLSPSQLHSHPWRLALRVVPHAEGPTMRAANGALGERDRVTPAVLHPMHDGDVYHMLNAFNHHHQHAVIQPELLPAAAHELAVAGWSGGDVRYSSTHRVAIETARRSTPCGVAACSHSQAAKTGRPST